MGPTNTALTRLFFTDQELRAAQSRYEGATRQIRSLERVIAGLREKQQAQSASLLALQARAGELDLDVKSREERIEKLRAQQQSSKNLKEYQAFLTEINADKAEKARSEDALLKVMEQVEKAQAEAKEIERQIAEHEAKLAESRAALGERIAQFEAEIAVRRSARDEAEVGVPARALEVFRRLCERYDGEALSPLRKPNPREEEYVCGVCNMLQVVDVYNRLHTRDELVFCRNCGRVLFIPADLPPEAAVNKPKPRDKDGGEKKTRARKPRKKAGEAVAAADGPKAQNLGPATEARPTEAKPAEAQPVAAQPAEAQPVEAQPAETQPVEAQPAETRPAETRPASGQAAEAQPTAISPAEAVEPSASVAEGGAADHVVLSQSPNNA